MGRKVDEKRRTGLGCFSWIPHLCMVTEDNPPAYSVTVSDSDHSLLKKYIYIKRVSFCNLRKALESLLCSILPSGTNTSSKTKNIFTFPPTFDQCGLRDDTSLRCERFPVWQQKPFWRAARAPGMKFIAWSYNACASSLGIFVNGNKLLGCLTAPANSPFSWELFFWSIRNLKLSRVLVFFFSFSLYKLVIHMFHSLFL